MAKEMLEIIDQIDKTWDRDMIIRYLYVKLAPFFQRDLNYFMSSEEEKKRQYNNGFVRNMPYVVCSTLVDFYIDLFSSFGIRTEKVIAIDTEIPLFALIVEGEFGWFYLDPLSDLFYNQYGIRAIYFGDMPFSNRTPLYQNYPFLKVLPREYVDYLDSKLGFSYRNDYFRELHLELAGRNSACKFFEMERYNYSQLIQKKLEFANQHLINLGSVPGPLERARLYLYITRMIFDRSEKKQSAVFLSNNDQENAQVNIKVFSSVFLKNENLLYEEEQKNGIYTLRRVM